MIWWDREFACKLKDVGIIQKMNLRYVDDINVAAKATVPGLRYVEGQIIMDTTKVEEDKKRASDERTMELIRQVGDDIHPSIKLEVDYPSKHPDKKLPILDLKVWVEQREKEVQGSNQMVSVIMYEFYTKEIASKALVNARSAMSASVKRTVLSQAVLRVLLNCSPLLPWANVVEKVEEMVLRMQYSGYNKKFRYEVVDSAIKAYRARQEAELKGERPMHRPKGWRRDERETEKSRKREDWYKKGGNEAVIFVPATPGSQLQKEYQREIRNQGYRIKVVEKTGTTLKEVLQRSDPFKRQRCGREDCLVCKQAGKGPCNAHGVTYKIECQGCEDKYIGETARNAYTRGVEHTEGLENQDERSALWKHCVEKHEKERQEFKMSVTGVYGNDAMLRQIAESVRINRVAKGSLINTKKEWNYVKLPRVVLDE